MTATTTAPVIRLEDIPRYFGGGWQEGGGGDADRQFDNAVKALIALTGRSEDDPAIRLITGQLDAAHNGLLSAACSFGRCIPVGLSDGIDQWEDEELFEVTGHRRKPADAS